VKSRITNKKTDNPFGSVSENRIHISVMDHLANAAALTQSQERLQELGVPRISSREEECEEAVEEFTELDALPAIKKPKHFRVSNNLRCAAKPGGIGHKGFSKKFVEYGCYSIEIANFDTKGGEERMRQQQSVEVGDILYMSESRNNDNVYRGIVKTKFERSSPSIPSFFNREDVLLLGNCKKGCPGWNWQSKSPEDLKAWNEKRCEYICQVEWSGPVEMIKSALNEGFIGKTIVSRTQYQGDSLDREFFKNEQ
jgi:hypothetical protein